MYAKDNTVYVDCYYYKIKVTHDKLLEYNLTLKGLNDSDLELKTKYKTLMCPPTTICHPKTIYHPTTVLNTSVINKRIPASSRSKICLDEESSLIQLLYSGSTKLYQLLPALFSA